MFRIKYIKSRKHIEIKDRDSGYFYGCGKYVFRDNFTDVFNNLKFGVRYAHFTVFKEDMDLSTICIVK